jgi:hypothetical protein
VAPAVQAPVVEKSKKSVLEPSRQLVGIGPPSALPPPFPSRELPQPPPSYPRDNAANKKIEEAINEHYVVLDFDKAEGVLTGTILACETKCRPATIARAWMYVGVVRGAGKHDRSSAFDAFSNALRVDQAVALDTALADEFTQVTFRRAQHIGHSAVDLDH